MPSGDNETIKQGDSRDGAALSAAQSDVRSQPRAGAARTRSVGSGGGECGQGSKRGTPGAAGGTGPHSPELGNDSPGLADVLPLPSPGTGSKFGRSGRRATVCPQDLRRSALELKPLSRRGSVGVTEESSASARSARSNRSLRSNRSARSGRGGGRSKRTKARKG